MAVEHGTVVPPKLELQPLHGWYDRLVVGALLEDAERPDKAIRDAGWARMMAEDPEPSTPMPFDGKRMFWGGFRPILDTATE